MAIKPFEPKFMKVGVLTAALQELTPREVRDPDPDRGDRGVGRVREGARRELHPAVGGAPSDGNRRAAGSDARSGGQHARPAQAVRQGSREAGRRVVEGHRRRHLRRRLLRQPAAPRSGGAQEEARLHAARVRRGGAARRQCRLRVRRPQSAAQHGREPRRLRAVVHPAAQGGKGARARPIASSSARCPDGRPATTGTTTSPTRPARGSRCTRSARSTASAISSAFTTTRRTRS